MITLTSALRVTTFVGLGVGLVAAWWRRARRRSQLVRQWRPSELELVTSAVLPARIGGDGAPTFVVLHGLGATADAFGRGFDVLADHGRVIVPDLLGFGRALDLTRSDFSVADHLEAIGHTEQALGPGGGIVVAGHSLGGALGIRWAASHRDRVERVVTWGAPLYVDIDTARGRIPGAMQRAVGMDTALAGRLCAQMCAHRDVAAAIAVATSPRTPAAIARQSVLHTWPAYRDALRHIVFDDGWIEALASLDDAGIPVEMVWGTRDDVGDVAAVIRVVESMTNVRVTQVAGADHRYPLVNPNQAVTQLISKPRAKRQRRTPA